VVPGEGTLDFNIRTVPLHHAVDIAVQARCPARLVVKTLETSTIGVLIHPDAGIDHFDLNGCAGAQTPAKAVPLLRDSGSQYQRPPSGMAIHRIEDQVGERFADFIVSAMIDGRSGASSVASRWQCPRCCAMSLQRARRQVNGRCTSD